MCEPFVHLWDLRKQIETEITSVGSCHERL